MYDTKRAVIPREARLDFSLQGRQTSMKRQKDSMFAVGHTGNNAVAMQCPSCPYRPCHSYPLLRSDSQTQCH